MTALTSPTPEIYLNDYEDHYFHFIKRHYGKIIAESAQIDSVPLFLEKTESILRAEDARQQVLLNAISWQKGRHVLDEYVLLKHQHVILDAFDELCDGPKEGKHILRVNDLLKI